MFDNAPFEYVYFENCQGFAYLEFQVWIRFVFSVWERDKREMTRDYCGEDKELFCADSFSRRGFALAIFSVFLLFWRDFPIEIGPLFYTNII